MAIVFTADSPHQREAECGMPDVQVVTCDKLAIPTSEGEPADFIHES